MVGHWLGRLITLQHTTEQDTALEKTVRRCPDLYHEVFNEPKRNEVLTAEPNAFSGLNAFGSAVRPANPAQPAEHGWLSMCGVLRSS